ncbi:S41 family peptidase [Virgibacillus alimentarius]|uniref:Carboxyl-terminal processing protease n=1 Tax=Virgibacillus alimentarius TaxID=698769 RepID=A0ABS4S5N4_9BACI|nr:MULTISPECIES: S41 family peptidase [Virgibacillus]MBP2256806.1 carboxyl-terminal processing protease [Virgibacillus alimentarius]HLR65675.1 S41 family peptidase [Virgibacillus sp.]
MILKKKYIILLLLAALIIGGAGSYIGIKLAQAEGDKQEKSIFEEVVNNGKDLETPESMSKVVQAYELINEHSLKDVDDTDLTEGAIQGMLESLDDPYSTYMDVESMERFNEQIESSFEGIGTEVSMVNDIVTVVAPIKDSPAEAAGLRPNDQIIQIDGESLEGLDLNEAVEKIRGEKGSEVVLEIERPGVSDSFEVSIVRDEIPLETVYPDIKTIEGKKTGILEITSFSETTADDFAEELAKLEEKGIEGLVIDVRGNPGGLLDSVEDILKHFVPEDMPYLQIEDKEGKKTPYYSDLEKKKQYPISVIVDEGSASASEILAVAMKEMGYDVVGTKTFGKGTVQQAIPLGDGSTMKLTFFKWLSPKGKWINEKGVTPTIEKEQPEYFYTNPIQIDKPLTYNHTGEKIKNVQIMLHGLDYNVDRTDGYFDKQTKKAVKAFQKENDMKATGKVDKKTAGLIESKIIDKIRSGEDDQQLERALSALYN